MGQCLSCFRPEEEENEVNERTSLLDGGDYGNLNYQEELAKSQQRQKELNAIVNELSESLVDVATFPVKANYDEYPRVLSEDKKLEIEEKVKHLDDAIKRQCIVKAEEPVYLNLD
ncbi:Piso0_004980 [Millerozyma farinosa CBS 7064]|uniref:Piso0_004980 protein n=1 Tax=Pichia sorbitophila (strain ATCC MYA-4447 / BCRC 22081 / CBS 7064 / NBRC 10061 / NRRL Y-12695) TaxID=559304 RepID=G8Y0Y3_PICSO|nr:Piso0_004980 [Millerozyma farinosa CBS 7064]